MIKILNKLTLAFWLILVGCSDHDNSYPDNKKKYQQVTFDVSVSKPETNYSIRTFFMLFMNKVQVTL